MFVVTADQIRSHADRDRVPSALRALAGVQPPALRPFQRTAGDEIQGVTPHPRTVLAVVERLVRQGHWRIGVGVGAVELPLPASTRAGRGTAFRAARAAIDAAHPQPGQLAVRAAADPSAGAAQASARERHAGYAEAALLLYARMLRERTPQGWQVVDLLTEGLTQSAAAARLGVSPSAVSQRVRRAGWQEQAQGSRLVLHHLSGADGRPEAEEGGSHDDDTGAAGRGGAARRDPGGLSGRSGDDLGVRPPGPP